MHLKINAMYELLRLNPCSAEPLSSNGQQATDATGRFPLQGLMAGSMSAMGRLATV